MGFAECLTITHILPEESQFCGRSRLFRRPSKVLRRSGVPVVLLRNCMSIPGIHLLRSGFRKQLEKRAKMEQQEMWEFLPWQPGVMNQDISGRYPLAAKERKTHVENVLAYRAITSDVRNASFVVFSWTQNTLAIYLKPSQLGHQYPHHSSH